MAVLGKDLDVEVIDEVDAESYEAFKSAATNGQPMLALSFLANILDSMMEKLDRLALKVEEAVAEPEKPAAKKTTSTRSKKATEEKS